jgi:hypothetical protein
MEVGEVEIARRLALEAEGLEEIVRLSLGREGV